MCPLECPVTGPSDTSSVRRLVALIPETFVISVTYELKDGLARSVH